MDMTEKLAKARAARRSKGTYTKLTPIEAAKADPTNKRKAITAKCYDCSNCQREEVTHCKVTSCPLWLIRPWQEKA